MSLLQELRGDEVAGEQTPLSGRFRLLSASELLSPAKCVVCGYPPVGDSDEKLASATSTDVRTVEKDESGHIISSEGSFIDGRLDFEFYGSVYFCKSCTLEMARLFGAVAREEIEDVKEAYLELSTREVQLTLKAERLEATNANLMAELLDRGSSWSSGPVDTYGSEDTSEIAKISETNDRSEIPSEPSGEPTPGDSEPDKFSGEQGRSDFSDSPTSDVSARSL